ncbi:KAP family P-loop NTPase fold protein [Undibacterium sp. Tian12W]|uniref:KAP family P-loop NTPase fold protein n=1 Tax=Undibacterium sp. Tian12W TaxID=3413054 RepID=UPI003BF41744
MAEAGAKDIIILGSDVPKSNPFEDSYGYTAFARQIAKAILVTPSPQGLVMAVHGPWGAGKSTLLNFVKCHLEETKEDSPILVIDFNPWWFNDKNHLVNQFLSTFQSSLKLAPSALQKVGDIMAKYSDALAATATTSAGAPWASKIVAWLLSKLNIKTEDIPQLKSKIAKALFESNTRVLFLIDDIDRLSPDEIRELFKAIKAIADFPNVIYLLSFDRDVVQLALNKSLGIDGASYLEKIVQVPFSLPSIDKILLRQQLFTNLSRVLESFPDIKFDEVYWHNVYVDGLDLFIEKPRDVVRLTNIFCVTFPPVAGEVNVVDFIALEFLRIFAPQVYETIRDNMDMFAGHSRQNRDAEDPLLVFHNTWLRNI